MVSKGGGTTSSTETSADRIGSMASLGRIGREGLSGDRMIGGVDIYFFLVVISLERGCVYVEFFILIINVIFFVLIINVIFTRFTRDNNFEQ